MENLFWATAIGFGLAILMLFSIARSLDVINEQLTGLRKEVRELEEGLDKQLDAAVDRLTGPLDNAVTELNVLNDTIHRIETTIERIDLDATLSKES